MAAAPSSQTKVGHAGIEAHRVVRTFGDVRALDGLDLTIPTGVLYGLVGPNGSGKTTLIRILVGLDDPTHGTATILGGPPETHAHDVGYMPQDEALYTDLSILENLEFFAGLYGGVTRKRIREILELVDLWDSRDRVVEVLSGGMRRRVSLAATLLHDPRILFLDEPTVGVDPVLRNEFWDSFRTRARRGAAILITTHHLEEARRCDRVGFLWKGRLLKEDTPSNLLGEAGTDSLEEAFLHALEEADLAG